MKYKELPDWVSVLKKDPRLASIGFTIYDEEGFVAGNKGNGSRFSFRKKKNGDFVMVGYSEKFSNECLVRITVDPERLNEARITLNEEACAIAFYCEPTFEALEKVYKDYVDEAKKIPKDANPVACVVRLRKGDVMCLPSPEKKELLYYLGNGNWDDMVGIENGMIFNRFVNLYTVCQATTEGIDGNVSQYYTAFSASLCSVIRYKAFGSTLFFFSFEYMPADSSFTRNFKSIESENALAKQFPDDAPLDIFGLLRESKSNILSSQDDLLKKAQEGDFDSLLLLTAMTDLTPKKFDQYFLPLASHPDIKFRDFVANEAHSKNHQEVVEEAIKHGISDEVLEQIKNP